MRKINFNLISNIFSMSLLIIPIFLYLGYIFIRPQYKFHLKYANYPTIKCENIYKEIFKAKIIGDSERLYWIYTNRYDGGMYSCGTVNGCAIISKDPTQRISLDRGVEGNVWAGFRLYEDGKRVKRGKLCE